MPDRLTALVDRITAVLQRRRLDELTYLTTDEAAEYLRISRSQFDSLRELRGIPRSDQMGKWVYRRRDLDYLMETAIWQATAVARTHRAASIGNSTGERTASGETPDAIDRVAARDDLQTLSRTQPDERLRL